MYMHVKSDSFQIETIKPRSESNSYIVPVQASLYHLHINHWLLSKSFQYFKSASGRFLLL